MAHGTVGRRRVRAIVGAAILAGVLGGGASAATYTITLDRLAGLAPGPEDEQPTFSGTGSVTFDEPVGGPAEIDALSLAVQTLSQVGDEDAVLSFEFGPGDVLFAEGLAGPLAPDLAGVVIGLGGKDSTGGEASLLSAGGPAALTLDFGAGQASAFCVGDSENLVQCIRGGGSSTGIEAELGAAVIPAPASLPMALTALGVLGLWKSGRRAG